MPLVATVEAFVTSDVWTIIGARCAFRTTILTGEDALVTGVARGAHWAGRPSGTVILVPAGAVVAGRSFVTITVPPRAIIAGGPLVTITAPPRAIITRGPLVTIPAPPRAIITGGPLVTITAPPRAIITRRSLVTITVRPRAIIPRGSLVPIPPPAVVLRRPGAAAGPLVADPR